MNSTNKIASNFFESPTEMISIQSMTDTKTYDVEATILQVKSLLDAGCDIVRISTPTLNEIEAFDQIVQELRSKGYDQKMVADIHFNPKPFHLITIKPFQFPILLNLLLKV